MTGQSPQAALLRPGRPWPLGATLTDGGVNFALYSSVAERVLLCLFDPTGSCEVAQLALPACTDGVWHGWLPLAGAARDGVVYGYRVQGPHAPAQGLRCNAAKLLLDPYARELVGNFVWHYAHRPGRGDAVDTAPFMPKARVRVRPFDWQDDQPPGIALADSVLYEVHVRGFTRCHPGVPETRRGTYSGLASPAAIAHLQRLGVTAVNLLPVHQAIDEWRLVQLGLCNYWGYNTLAYFVPEARHHAAEAGVPVIDEFKAMVRDLHAAGIEVILDVVFNHTAESDALGPTLCWRGIDNAAYYRLPADDAAGYENVTGCGNTLRLDHPRTLQLVLDSLRYWVQEFHVDGFRFDLAVTLGRTARGFAAAAPFFLALAQDPVLARVKCFAEPWDIGPDGFQLGQFPAGWSEWNAHFRDDVRAFWTQASAPAAALATRLCGSSDLFRQCARAPQASLNFITAHDGFTLRDLVSYGERHNQANGEDNRDGHGHNLSCNGGVEGETTDPAVLAERARLQRALLATLLLARGVPMLLAGDEIGRTQRGNNNAYCQDNAINWLDWPAANHDLLETTTRLLALRRDWPVLRSRDWLTGQPLMPASSGAAGDPPVLPADVVWRSVHGGPCTDADWAGGTLVCQLYDRVRSAFLLLAFNRTREAVMCCLPAGGWRQLFDSAVAAGRGDGVITKQCWLAAQSVQVLTAPLP